MKLYYEQTCTEKIEIDICLGEILELGGVRKAIDFFKNDNSRLEKYHVIHDPVKNIKTGKWDQLDKGYFEDLVNDGEITKEWLEEFLNETIWNSRSL